MLRKILARYDVWEDSSRGNGSHTMFFRRIDGCVFSFPIPTHGTDVLQCYVQNIRKRFRLTEADGVTDAEFYG